MSYFLRNIVREEDELLPNTPDSKPFEEKTKNSAEFGNLLRHFVRLPPRGQVLHLPTAIEETEDSEAG